VHRRHRALLPYGRVLDLAPQYRRETNNYKAADIGARGRVRAEEKKNYRYWVGEQPKQRREREKVDTPSRGWGRVQRDYSWRQSSS